MAISVTPPPYRRRMEVVSRSSRWSSSPWSRSSWPSCARSAAPSAPEVPIDLVVQEAVAHAPRRPAACAGAVEQLVRMNQEMLEAERRLGTQELDGTRGADRPAGGRHAHRAGPRSPGCCTRSRPSDASTSASCSSQLREAGRHTQVLAETTQSLREALSSTTARGQWGERMADDVLRLAGFVDGVNYRRQQALAGLGGHPRLHVPPAAGPVPAHGREVPAQQLPALPRRHVRRRARAVCARSS